MEKNNELSGLSNEITYQRYLIEHGKVKRFFTEFSLREYVALNKIWKCCNSRNGNQKAYIYELAEYMKLTSAEMSRVMESLKQRGLVIWTHDGDGSEGTYAKITENGVELIVAQHERLRNYYGRVINVFGMEKFNEFLNMMKELELIMDQVAEEMGE